MIAFYFQGPEGASPFQHQRQPSHQPQPKQYRSPRVRDLLLSQGHPDYGFVAEEALNKPHKPEAQPTLDGTESLRTAYNSSKICGPGSLQYGLMEQPQPQRPLRYQIAEDKHQQRQQQASTEWVQTKGHVGNNQPVNMRQPQPSEIGHQEPNPSQRDHERKCRHGHLGNPSRQKKLCHNHQRQLNSGQVHRQAGQQPANPLPEVASLSLDEPKPPKFESDSGLTSTVKLEPSKTLKIDFLFICYLLF